MQIWSIDKILALSAKYDCDIAYVYNSYSNSYSVMVRLPRKKSMVHFTVFPKTVDDVYNDIVKLLEESK